MKKRFPKILLVESFYGGSHKSWVDGLLAYSASDIELVSFEDKNWKWRMQGGAAELAEKANRFLIEPGKLPFDLILVSSLIDLPLFKAMLHEDLSSLPIVLYMHENQFSYPSTTSKKDLASFFGFINLKSAAIAEKVLFNSIFHQEDFLSHAASFLETRPDHNLCKWVPLIREKSRVISPGLHLQKFEAHCPSSTSAPKRSPIFLWNHRWEPDKNPEEFFKGLIQLKEEGYDFKLHVLGEGPQRKPECFLRARDELGDRVLSFGFAESFSEYAKACWESDFLWVTSYHDFFGISVLEAVYCGCQPLLPRRQAYPDHFNSDEVFYSSYSEALQKLRVLLGRWDESSTEQPLRPELSKAVQAYDWSNVITSYDEFFESITQVASIPPRVL